MEIEEKIVKRNGKFFVMSESGKKLGGPFDTKGEASKRLGQVEHFKKESITWEALDFNYKLTEREDKTKVLSISGVALKTGVSRNKVNYRIKNLEENDGTGFNFLVGHRKDYDNPDHNVGEGVYSLQGNELKYQGEVENTIQHPNIVEQIQKGRVSVSVHGGFESHEHKGNEVIIEGLKIPLLAFVNKHVRGVEAASIEAAIEERIGMDDDVDEDVEEKMEQDFAKVIKDKDDLLKEREDKIKEVEEALHNKAEDLKKMKKKEEEDKAAKKQKVAESLVEVNKELKQNELMEKSLEVLETMLQYEKKEVSESNGGEGDSEVDDKPENKNIKEGDFFKNIVTDKETGDISMTESSRRKFNDEIMNSIYR